MTHGSLFSGIGGFDLAAEWMGWENIFHCEWNEFGQKVLNYYWPKAISYGDITKTDFTIHRGAIDILTGGFPCQPFSVAGDQKGKEDERFLWPEMLRAIKEIHPHYIVAENVFGILNNGRGMVFEQVCAEMENEGYEVQPYLLPACAKGAWHRRDRFWFIAHSIYSSDSSKFRTKGKEKEIQGINRQAGCSREFIGADNTFYTNHRSERNERFIKEEIQELTGVQRSEDGGIYAVINGRTDLSTPVLCRSYDGIPKGMDRVAAYGNAIVPQVAYEIFKAIEQYEKNE